MGSSVFFSCSDRARAFRIAWALLTITSPVTVAYLECHHVRLAFDIRFNSDLFVPALVPSELHAMNAPQVTTITSAVKAAWFWFDCTMP